MNISTAECRSRCEGWRGKDGSYRYPTCAAWTMQLFEPNEANMCYLHETNSTIETERHDPVPGAHASGICRSYLEMHPEGARQGFGVLVGRWSYSERYVTATKDSGCEGLRLGRTQARKVLGLIPK